VRGAFIQFLVTGAVALVIIAAIAFIALRRESNDEAIRDARNLTAVLARSIVEPNLAELPGVVKGDAAALAEFDRQMRGRILDADSPVVRMKIWQRDGRVVYSDLQGLTGSVLGFDKGVAFDSGRVIAEVTDLTAPENRFDNLSGRLLEVYLPIEGPDGEKYLFETYQQFSLVTSGRSTVLGKFLPIFLIALGVLALVQAPLAWSLARRLRDGQREREDLLQSAIEASDRERRRIASDIHDGPVQQLAGLSFTLAGAADRVGSDTESERSRLREAAAATRSIMRQLRGLLVEIHPPNLHTTGLEAALSDLLAPLGAKGIETSLRFAEMPAMPADTEALLYRGAQEALRNVAEHSGAQTVSVDVSRSNGAVTLEVRDDGRGFDARDRVQSRTKGHLGLELLENLVSHSGGEMQIESDPAQGTRLGIRVPVQ
jgi:signal transduction histidine kinase